MAEEKTISATIPLKSGFTHVLLNIAAQGYHWVKVSYSGGGDDGSVDEVELIPAEALDIEDNELKWHDHNYEGAKPDQELVEVLEDFVYEKVLSKLDDWWNNEGGGGTMYVSTLDASYHVDHYVNVTETIDSKHDGKLGDY